ncbi:phage tail assembly protein [Viridibacillus arvi]|uniref:phage tail assembly protein n=1 Tax=Viridibacillus arvi TaxID=263475 RepID=UPI0034D00F28
MKPIILKKPITIDDKKVHEINLRLDEMTGADLLSIDTELRIEGLGGLDNVLGQSALVRIASKASSIFLEDLEKLGLIDFIDVTYTVRNFILGTLEIEEEPQKSEKSSEILEVPQETESPIGNKNP